MTYPVAVEITAPKSFVQYSIAMAKTNEVKKPMTSVDIRARGTTTAAF